MDDQCNFGVPHGKARAELLPCPFCGGKPELVTRNVEPQGDPWYGRKDETFVLCDCGACLFDGAFHEGFWDAETRAVEAWNRRTPPPPTTEGTPRAGKESDPQLVGYDECGCILTQYCDGTCRPVFAMREVLERAKTLYANSPRAYRGTTPLPWRDAPMPTRKEFIEKAKAEPASSSGTPGKGENNG